MGGIPIAAAILLGAAGASGMYKMKSKAKQ